MVKVVAEIANSSKSNKTRKVVEAVELINLWNSRCKTSDNCNGNEVVIVAEVLVSSKSHTTCKSHGKQ